jgi:hypothetical protein
MKGKFMKWIVHPDVRSETVALEFCREFAAEFSIDQLDWVRIDLGRGKYSGAYGRCWYATKTAPRKGYRISIQVPGPFPHRHIRYVRPIYQLDNGVWPPVPPGMQPAGYCQAVKKGIARRWLRLTTEYEFETRAIAIVHLFGHEMFHFLRMTKQIPGVNRENEADQFALSVEAAFRNGRSPA